MKAKDLREKTVSELNDELTELRKEQFNLRMQKGMGEMPKPHLYKEVRRNIARIKTLIAQKERES